MPRIRSGYSFRVAVGKLENVAQRLVDCGYPALPLTDRASMFGFVRWQKLAEKFNLKPVFGVELAVTDSINAKRPSVDYWTFIAQDNLVELNLLFELATTQFRYEPLLTYEQAQKNNLFKIIGHRSNLDLISPSDETFVALSPAIAKGYFNLVQKRGLHWIGCSDNKFPTPEDKALYEVICGRNASIQTYEQFIQNGNEWKQSVSKIADDKIQMMALANTALVLSKSNAKMKKATLYSPEKTTTLRKMCEDGAEKLKVNLADPIYKERLDRELALIEEKKFEDYFFIIADLCQWARKVMIVGPARGSSCGSLVCYLLEITTIDPIPYGLIFERFIDIQRADLPDIDIDFSDQHRHLVTEYLQNKYGAEHIARLGTVAMYMADSVLKEAGTALQIPKWMTEAVSESMIKRSSGDARALDTIEDTFKTMQAGKDLIEKYPNMLICTQMEGSPRHSSQHASGVVLTKEPVNHHVAIDRRTNATQCDKKDAETLNLLKIDVLGLTQLSILENALELAKLDRFHLNTIPMNDPEAFEILNQYKFAGIFQYDGLALQSLSKQFKIKELNDIVSTTALARPGPLASGGANEWIARKNGVNPVTYPHAMFEPYLSDTLGCVLYQEQVMNIGRNVGDLSWEDVSSLRKAMSKSMGKEFFDKFGDKWKPAAIAKGGDPKLMTKVWDDLCSYGSWSFNKSHAVAYGVISYWCCWLKAHYPFEFAAATLNFEDDPIKQLKILREIVAEGYDYIPVDSEKSTDKWIIGQRNGKKILIGPITNIKGIGPKMVATILSARKRNEPLPSRAEKLLYNPKTPIDSLWPIKDGFKKLLPDPTARNIFTPPTNIKQIEIRKKDYEVLVFCTLSKINPRDLNEAVLVAKRGGKKAEGPTAYLNLMLTDDTDTIFGKIGTWQYATMGKEVVDRGKPNKCLYAVKGIVKGGGTFRMIMIKNIRYIGDL